MSQKCTYLFSQTSWENSTIKRAWTGVVSGWLSFQEVIVEPCEWRQSMGKDHVVICRVGNKSLKPPRRGALTIGQGWAHGPEIGCGTHW